MLSGVFEQKSPPNSRCYAIACLVYEVSWAHFPQKALLRLFVVLAGKWESDYAEQQKSGVAAMEEMLCLEAGLVISISWLWFKSELHVWMNMI